MPFIFSKEQVHENPKQEEVERIIDHGINHAAESQADDRRWLDLGVFLAGIVDGVQIAAADQPEPFVAEAEPIDRPMAQKDQDHDRRAEVPHHQADAGRVKRAVPQRPRQSGGPRLSLVDSLLLALQKVVAYQMA